MKKKTNHHLHHRNNRSRSSNSSNTNNNNSVLGILQSVIFCRRRRFRGQLLPFISAVGGCILFFFAIVSFLSPPINHHHVHHFRYNHSSLDDEIDFRSNIGNTSTFLIPRAGGSLGDEIWRSTQSQSYYGCSQKSENHQDVDAKTNDSRFLMIVTSGGLNQQRTGITDAVVAAYILNSTLVVPKLDNKSYWKDQSNFSDIFDVDWFISYLSKDVKIVKEVPMIEGRSIHPYQMRIPRKCDPECYHSRALPLLEKKKVVMLTKFDYRLSNRLDPDLQKLRCRANYHALRYTEPICEMGEKLVERMRMKSKRFIALHLRFESDMLAFSGCYFGGGDREREELEQIRTRWETLHKRDPDKERRLGRCPLTPEEVGLMLRALGYGEDVHIYVASGEVYGGENTLSPLKQLFPNFHSKDTIATKEELAPFAPYSSRMAALDFIVCNASDVFVTNNNGNMAKMLAGRRRYFGYKPTIRPNAKKLYRLFLDRGNMTWEEFASRVRTHQIGFMGRPNEAMPGKGEFHEYPIVCICEDLNTQIQNRSQGLSQNQSEPNNHDVQANKRDRNESESVVKEQQRGNEEHNNSYTQQIENGNGTRVKELLRRNKNDSDCGLEEGHQTNT
ncbi:O-fucosyltransferase 6-like [Cynara cardunculus var. scolymus]|uniref:O-fucosyltransferase 6-like n=1 Tax=Cynara cardunculus var. scolymus TaxID=59895 RepID=UPI000D62F205|nr:O-fucosyltransferase 6-like [Cynara cardunculus var. scolymus]